MTSYSSFRGLGKHTKARQTGFLDSTQNKSEVKKSVYLTWVSLPNPLNDGGLTSLLTQSSPDLMPKSLNITIRGLTLKAKGITNE